MKVFKFLPPYRDGRTSFPKTNKRSGVYLIKENGKLVYVGMSKTNLYKTLYRHFETWSSKHQVVTTYVNKLHRFNYTVRVIMTTPPQAIRLERALIKKYNPRDNSEKYKAYELDFYDRQTVKTFRKTEVETKDPF